MTRRITRWHSGHPETICGRGSKVSETELIRTLLPRVCQSYDVHSVADVGCGDQNWVQHVEWPDSVHTYRGYDYEHAGERFDCTQDVLPQPYDLVMMIYVLNHLYAPNDVLRTIANLKLSGSRLLLATYHEESLLPLPLIESTFHKEKSGLLWSYGLWRLNDE